jgi:hypothetical protein
MIWDSPLAGKNPALAVRDHPVWESIEPHFRTAEFSAPYGMDANFLVLLYRIRLAADVPFRITSDARDPDGNIGVGKSAHKKRPCKAVDLKVHNSFERMRVVAAAIREGINRVGVYPAADDGSGVVHLDAEVSSDNPSPRLWTDF